MPVEFLDLPPADAVRHFRAKGMHVGFGWRSTAAEAHAVSFTVAKAMRFDILRDLRAAVDRAQADGVPFREFVADLKPRLQRLGWWGRRKIVDPLTKREAEVLIGPRRLRTIFDANLASAAAAGQWRRIERVKDTRPYLRYSAVQDGRTRPEHLAWHGIVLPVDHEFWETHFPPNGWRCRCVVTQLSEDDLAERGWKVSPDPEPDTYRWVNRRTGSVHQVPRGIDPGWDRNVGKIDRIAEMQRTLIDKTAAAAGGTDPALKALADAAVKPDAGDFGETFGYFLRHATSKWRTNWPMAVLAPERLKELDMPHDSPAVVTLAGKTAGTKKHRKRFLALGLEDWTRVQRIVEQGARIPHQEKPHFPTRRVLWAMDGREWVVVLEPRPTGEVSLITYFASGPRYVTSEGG